MSWAARSNVGVGWAEGRLTIADANNTAVRVDDDDFQLAFQVRRADAVHEAGRHVSEVQLDVELVFALDRRQCDRIGLSFRLQRPQAALGQPERFRPALRRGNARGGADDVERPVVPID